MAGTMVFIFLLDQLPGNILNKTLETVQVTHTDPSSFLKCDHTITDPILQILNRELDVIMIPKWMYHEKDLFSINANNSGQKISNDSYETLLKMNKVVESSNEVKAVSGENRNLHKLEDYETEDDSVLNETAVDSSKSESKVPEKEPLLVAIFESLSNVTAQTCGGTLLSSRWVLTASNCVNLLRNLHGNITEKSGYTIIINATDPLLDGTAHNVTEILLHPEVSHVTKPPELSNDNNVTTVTLQPEVSHIIAKASRNNMKSIALMRIDPPVDIEDPVIEENITAGMQVQVYGWAMKQTESGHDAMHAVAFEAQTLTPTECAARYNVTKDLSEVCLLAHADYDELISQLSWGGAVVAPSGGVLGVARGDGDGAPLAATPLSPYAVWIHDTIGTKEHVA